jgi:sugar fermentation stimulation protein A
MDKGSYVLLMQLKSETHLAVGKLGEFDFHRGYYMYCGSALGGLSARINRHLRPDKQLHWHIDYLLRFVDILEVWYISSDRRLECILCNEARTLSGSEDVAPGFGSSDCRCLSHLLYFKMKPSLEALDEKLLEKGFMLSRWQAT